MNWDSKKVCFKANFKFFFNKIGKWSTFENKYPLLKFGKENQFDCQKFDTIEHKSSNNCPKSAHFTVKKKQNNCGSLNTVLTSLSNP